MTFILRISLFSVFIYLSLGIFYFRISKATFINPDDITGIVGDSLNIAKESANIGQGSLDQYSLDQANLGLGNDCGCEGGEGVPPIAKPSGGGYSTANCQGKYCDNCPISGTKYTDPEPYVTSGCGNSKVTIKCVTNNYFIKPNSISYDKIKNRLIFTGSVNAIICAFYIQSGILYCASLRGIYTIFDGVALIENNSELFVGVISNGLYLITWDGRSASATVKFVRTASSNRYPDFYLSGIFIGPYQGLYYKSASLTNFFSPSDVSQLSTLYYDNGGSIKIVLQEYGKIDGYGLVSCGTNSIPDTLIVVCANERKTYSYAFDASTATIQSNATVVASGKNGYPSTLFVDSDNKIWITINQYGQLLRYDPCTKQLLCEITLPAFGALDVTIAPCSTVPGSLCLYVLSDSETCSASGKDPKKGSCVLEISGVPGLPQPNPTYSVPNKC